MDNMDMEYDEILVDPTYIDTEKDTISSYDINILIFESILNFNRNRNILELDYDNLVIILKNLDITDLMNLSRTNKQLQEMICKYMIENYQNWERKITTNDTFNWMLRNYNENFIMIDLGNIKKFHWDFLQQFIMVNVKKLIVTFDFDYDDPDQLTTILVYSFPNVEDLTIFGNINTEIISNLKSLKRLLLHFVKRDPTQIFEFLFKKCKLEHFSLSSAANLNLKFAYGNFSTIYSCRTLRSLWLTSTQWQQILSRMNVFPHLYEIGVYNLTDEVAKGFFGVVGHRITKLELFDDFDYPWLYILNLKNLREFKIENLSLILFKRAPIVLEQLCPINTELWSDYETVIYFAIVNLIYSSTIIEKITIPFHWVRNIFKFQHLINIVVKQSARTVPLKLHLLYYPVMFESAKKKYYERCQPMFQVEFEMYDFQAARRSIHYKLGFRAELSEKNKTE